MAGTESDAELNRDEEHQPRFGQHDSQRRPRVLGRFGEGNFLDSCLSVWLARSSRHYVGRFQHPPAKLAVFISYRFDRLTGRGWMSIGGGEWKRMGETAVRKFEITDTETGRKMVVEGTAPPTQAEAAELFVKRQK